ncbi:MAG: beta-N-acetylhexosaminidase [Bacteroidales bacterium]|nr:beta-N-acetylhexosaminidase [Bacteroidales bacterium]
MKKVSFLLLGIIFCSGVVKAQHTESCSDIIPAPVECKEYKHSFEISSQTEVVANVNRPEYKVAKYLEGVLKKVFSSPKHVKKYKNSINFILSSDKKLGKEGYVLDMGRKQITIEANEEAGFFYAVQSLLQLYNIAPNGDYIWTKNDSVATKVDSIGNGTGYMVSIRRTAVKIADYPRFSYRGKHLDVARHFFNVEEVKRYLDLLAYHKINRFHWHLTDDQGWRIEIKKYPLLTQIASCRDHTMIGHYKDYKKDEPVRYDGKKYCAFYTQEEIKEIVQYAADRYITVIPEIEMPGHSCAVLEAYPQYSCRKSGIKAVGSWGVFEDVLCCNDSTFRFMEDILSEVCELFPSEYIHIGGDECPKTRWKECPICQRTMKEQGLKDENELQSYFIRTIEKFLLSKGRRIIGWDEILDGGVTRTATIMSWRGEKGGYAAAKDGNDAIMVPEQYLYFNWYQANPETEPLAFSGLTPLEKVYHYNPIPEGLNAEEQKHIIGLQANTWTEYIDNFPLLMYMDYPRTAALSEIGWSSSRDYDKFLQRLKILTPLYRKMQQKK